MRLLFYIHAIKGGGAERVCVTLANGFSKLGHDIFISCNTGLPIAYDIDKDVAVLNHREGCETTSIFSRVKLYRLIRMLWNMRSEAKKIRPDYAIGIMEDFTFYTAVSLFGLGIPVIGSHHSALSRMSKKYRFLLTPIIPRIAAMEVLTNHDYRLLKEKYNNVVRMPNPVDLQETIPNNKRKKVVFTAGRVGHEPKGHENLMCIWNNLYKSNPDWELWIAGNYDQETYDRLTSLLIDKDNARVRFLGFRNDVFNLMQESEIYVLPSRWEGLPMGLIEAMNAGCCCVAYDVETGPSDIIKNGENGLLVENQNIEKMTEALSIVMNNPDLRHKLAQKAPDAVSKFSTYKIIERWMILFNKISRK